MTIKERHKHPTPKDQEKLEVLKRDGFACVICRTQEYLETAHVNHFAGEKPSEGRRYYKLSSPDQQLVTVCHYHHAIYDGRLRIGIRLLLEASKDDDFAPELRGKLIQVKKDRAGECLRLRKAVSVYIEAFKLWPNELNWRLLLTEQALNL